jgi:ribosomal protein L3
VTFFKVTNSNEKSAALGSTTMNDPENGKGQTRTRVQAIEGFWLVVLRGNLIMVKGPTPGRTALAGHWRGDLIMIKGSIPERTALAGHVER